MTSQKTALVAISADRSSVGTIAIGTAHMTLGTKDVNVTKILNNTGINVQTSTSQVQKCDTVGGHSGIADSCTANSKHIVDESGGLLNR